MVWIGLVRPIAGYLLLAPCGPVWSKFSASEITLPFFTSCAAAMMSAGLVKLSVPISSSGPHLPQFLYFSAASRRSWRVSLRFDIVPPCIFVLYLCAFFRCPTKHQRGRHDNAVPHSCFARGHVLEPNVLEPNVFEPVRIGSGSSEPNLSE